MALLNKLKSKDKTVNGLENVETQDEALFTSLEQEKKRKKRRRRIIIIAVVAVLLIGAVIGIIAVKRNVSRKYNSRLGDVVSYDAKIGSISTTVSGTGSLANVDEETITVPYGVDIDEVIVEAGDVIKKGDVIAKVDIATVKSAMADIQSEMNLIDEELDAAAEDATDSNLYSGVAGRVKKIYIKEYETVSDCMYKNGALVLLSLDGYMAVDIENSTLSSGDAVTVVLSDGEKKENGRVEISAGGTSTILITDDGTEYGDTVTVIDASGNTLGKGELYVHNPLRITAVNGTAAHIYVDENQKIYKGSVICSLTDTDYTANYASLLKSRGELEDTLLDLVTIYNDGALLAPYNGSVSTVIYDENSTTSTTTTTTTTTTVMMGNMAQTTQASSTSSDLTKDIDIITLSPDKEMSASISVDESNILSLEVGQTAQVTISSIGDEIFEGTVTEINKTANSSYGVTRYTAVITIDKTEKMLAGMKASVVVRIQGVDDAVIIPVEALHQTSSSSFVYTGYDKTEGKFTGMVEVEAGIQNSSYVEIISGLKEGDKVFYTETEDSMFATMGGFGGPPGGMGGDFSGGMPDFGNGGPPDFSGGMPGGGNFSGPPSGGNFGGGGMSGRR